MTNIIQNFAEISLLVKELKVIIFDLDDTLYDEKEYIKSGYKAIAQMFPHILNAQQVLWHLFEIGEPAIDCFLKSYDLLTEENKNICLNAYRFQEPDIHLNVNIKKGLISLKKNGYKLGIITDGRPEGQRAKIRALKLDKLIDNIIITDELGGIQYRKPNETAFKIMQQHFGVKFSEMCYVGDNQKKDFIAPEKLGMKTIWIKNKNGLYN